jgi:SOS response regulatory protein OraA/RecX
MPDWKKIDQIFSMIETTRTLAMSGLRSRYPDASEEELKKRLAALVFDRETVMKVYGWDPDKEGY